MLEIKLLACTYITEAARKELARAGCPVHSDVLWGELENVEIVELQHCGGDDLQVMSVWSTPREIQISSRSLFLHYQWHINHNGFVLTLLDEEIPEPEPAPSVTNVADELGDIDEHPF